MTETKFLEGLAEDEEVHVTIDECGQYRPTV
jgi:hypothetical protein